MIFSLDDMIAFLPSLLQGALLTIAPNKAADLIYAAYRKRAEVVYVPWFWRLIMGAIRLIPESRFKRVSF